MVGKAPADAGVGLERIAELLGHENLETTQVYVTLSKQDLVAVVEQIAWSD